MNQVRHMNHTPTTFTPRAPLLAAAVAAALAGCSPVRVAPNAEAPTSAGATHAPSAAQPSTQASAATACPAHHRGQPGGRRQPARARTRQQPRGG
jgi:hypothetical protein